MTTVTSQKDTGQYGTEASMSLNKVKEKSCVIYDSTNNDGYVVI
jgi:hypothetical protein